MRIQAGHLAAMGFAQPMQAVDNVDVEVEEGVTPRIAVQGIFDEPLGGRDLHAEGLGKRFSLRGFCDAGDPSKIRRFEGMLEHGLRMRIGRRTERTDDPLIELTGIGTVADEMKEPARVEIICQMQKVKLLSDDPYHTSQRGPHGIGSWDATLLVELIGQTLAHAMRLALHTRNAVPHREEERPVRQIARQQPEAVVAQIEHDAPLRELRRKLDAGHDRDRPAVSRLEYGSD